MQLTAGIIGPAHGLRGDVLVDIRTDNVSRFEPGSTVTTTLQEWPHLTVGAIRSQRDRFIISFNEITTREIAEGLRGVKLLVDEQYEEDAWYPYQLRGLSVKTPSGVTLGEVKDLRLGVAQDLLVVRHRGNDVLVPFVQELVPEVNIGDGIVVIDPPLGLFGEDDGEEELKSNSPGGAREDIH